MIVRDYCPETDLTGLRACIVTLQDFESGLDPRFPDGASIVDAYVPDILRRCEAHNGRILVAVVDGDVAGYAMIWASVKGGEIEDGDFEAARLADLAVLERYRRQGVATALIKAAENYAREQGATCLHIGVMAANRRALALYDSCGYAPCSMKLEKHL